MSARKRFEYAQEHHEWLRANYAGMTNEELAEAFTERFGLPYSADQASNYARSHGLRKDAEAASRARQSGRYGPEHIAWLREHVPGHSRKEIIAAYAERFGVTLTKNALQYAKRLAGVTQDVHLGNEKGSAPWNKGRPWGEWMSEEGASRTARNLYKPGNRPHNAYHRLLDVRDSDKSGPMIFVNPRNARDDAHKWISLGRYEWMMANGRDFPEGHHLVYADRNRENYAPDNLVAVPDELYAVVASGCHGQGIRYYDRESLDAAVALARLNMRRLEMERTAPRPCRVCGKAFVPPAYQHHYAARVTTCPACNRHGKKTREERHD